MVVNPAVVPRERFDQFLGPQKNYHTGADWVMTEEYVEQLLILEVEPLVATENILLMVQTGDENPGLPACSGQVSEMQNDHTGRGQSCFRAF